MQEQNKPDLTSIDNFIEVITQIAKEGDTNEGSRIMPTKMKVGKLILAFETNEWSDELLAESGLSADQQNELRTLGSFKKDGFNALMVACENHHSAIEALSILFLKLPADTQEDILLQKTETKTNARSIEANALLLILNTKYELLGQPKALDFLRKLKESFSTICNLIKKLKMDAQIEIFNQLDNIEGDGTLLNFVLAKAPHVGTRDINNHANYDTKKSTKREYFSAVIEPLLGVMKNFPSKVRLKTYFHTKMFLFMDFSPEQRSKIKEAILTHPFTSTQKTIFTLGAGATLTGGSMMILITAGVFASAAFVALAWPLAIAVVATGAATMLAVSLYARFISDPLDVIRQEEKNESEKLLPVAHTSQLGAKS